MKWNLLYFEDQFANIECYQFLLKDRFEVIGCLDATMYKNYLQKYEPHAILIDVHMPGLPGHELHDKIVSHRCYNGCPIIFVSGDVSDETKIKSYTSGGVDYLTREMPADEIEGRLASKIRLYQKTASKLRIGNLQIDFDSLKVFIEKNTIDLTMMEMRILVSLVRFFPDGLTRDELLRLVWDNDVKPGTINTYATWIKAKLAEWDHVIHIKNENVLIKKKLVERVLS